jgi:Ca2+-binding RTX toxin-like protein
MQVTVAAGHGSASLTYNVADRAYTAAKQSARLITRMFGTTGTSYDPASPPVTPANGGYLYALAPTGETIKANGFQAVVVQNSGAATVVGGGNSNQTVLGSNGGLTFVDTNDTSAHDTFVDLGGGDNVVNLSGSQGLLRVDIDNGSNTIIGGNGAKYIDAGAGGNTVSLGGGYSNVFVEGHDDVYLGAGIAVVQVNGDAGANATVHGSSSAFSDLWFINGAAASTVTAGAGTDYVYGSVGGGVFTGGSAGGNVLLGGTGAVTLFGGGSYDYLQGGSNGDNSIKAAGGNSTLVASAGGSDTLVAGTGKDTFSLVTEAAGKNYTISGYSAADHIVVDKAGFTGATDKVVGGSSIITLSDNTKITLVGYNSTNINFGHT